MDISSRTLITELAPWSSLVQRFGRCNRKGEFNSKGGADIFLINLEAEDEKAARGLALPYTPEQFAVARTLLQKVEHSGAAPTVLEKIHADEPLAETHILRRKDLVDLFDTTPDLAGLDIDVGRYIRDDDDRDVQVFWREAPKDEMPAEEIEPLRRELVRVSLGEFERFWKKDKTRIWYWNVLDGKWLKPERVAPGQIYLVDVALGGYSEILGWTGEKTKKPFKILSIEHQPAHKSARDGQGDIESLVNGTEKSNENAFQSIEQHTNHVVAACQEIINALPPAVPWSQILLTSAIWHDVGKAHVCFQKFITKGRMLPDQLKGKFIAKAPWISGSKHERPHFRHELASALAWLQAGICDDSFKKNLVAYLVAAHHGKVRLSIRSMPGEKAPEGENLFARGIWNGDKLPDDLTKELTLEGLRFSQIILDLSCMKMGDENGRPSWTNQALSLRDQPELGIFRLGWLETLLRAADAQGSKR